MSESSKVFKSSLFGYKPDSVIDYIESLNNRSAEKLGELEGRFYAEHEENSSLRSKLSEALSSVDASNKKIESLMEELENLQKEICNKDAEKMILEGKLSDASKRVVELESQLAISLEKLENASNPVEKPAYSVVSSSQGSNRSELCSDSCRRAKDNADVLIIEAEEKAFEIIEEAKKKAQENAKQIIEEAENQATRNLQKTRYLLKRQERLKETILQHKREIDSFYEGLARNFGEDTNN